MSRVAEVAWVFLRLGCLSFGGPVAHLGFFRAELVERRGWLDDARYGDLVALCQFLPGPASSQVAFALGRHRAGLPGALAASAAFTLPSTLLMLGFAFGLARVGGAAARWQGGLLLAAVAVVAQAVWGMGQRLCPDRRRQAICVGAAAALLVAPGAATQLAALALGGALGWRLYRGSSPPAPATSDAPGGRGAGAAALVVFAALLVALPIAARASGSREVALVDAFYRAGSLVFGGGHVVLPLLHAELVPRGWVGEDAFLSGYAAAQAVPGPLFTFAAYLGAAIAPGPSAARGLACLLAVFLPGWLLVAGALPFWERLRARAWAQATLAGANAAVVGVLLAALYEPVFTHAVHGPRDAAIALVAFALLEVAKAPPWAVVAGAAAAAGLG